MGGARRELRVAGQAEPISHFTDAVEAGGFLFVSGIVPVDEQRELVGGDDVVAQARCVFENMRRGPRGRRLHLRRRRQGDRLPHRCDRSPARQPRPPGGVRRDASGFDPRRGLRARHPGCEDRGRVRGPLSRERPLQHRDHLARRAAARRRRRAARRAHAARQGPDRHRRDPHDLRLAHLRRPCPDRPRDGRPARARRRRRRRRQGQPARVRVGRSRRQPVVRRRSQPAPSREDHRRFLGRERRGARRRARRPRARNGHRLLDPPAVGRAAER